jgi:hypothetical protein
VTARQCDWRTATPCAIDQRHGLHLFSFRGVDKGSIPSPEHWGAGARFSIAGGRHHVVAAWACRAGVGPALHFVLMTPHQKLHLLVDELTDAEAEAALARLVRERVLLEEWTATADTEATEDAWVLTNAREAIREKPWYDDAVVRSDSRCRPKRSRSLKRSQPGTSRDGGWEAAFGRESTAHVGTHSVPFPAVGGDRVHQIPPMPGVA